MSSYISDCEPSRTRYRRRASASLRRARLSKGLHALMGEFSHEWEKWYITHAGIERTVIIWER